MIAPARRSAAQTIPESPRPGQSKTTERTRNRLHARAFAHEGLNAALLTAGGEAVEKAILALHAGGRVAYANGVRPEPQARSGIRLRSYNGEPDPEIIGRLQRLIESGPFEVHVARTFPLEKAAEAHRALGSHHLGKFALRIHEDSVA